jgi:hypothetical protein
MPVDAMTPKEPGETPALIDMTADEAREITEAIKTTVKHASALIVDAYHRPAWLALGYPTWDAYCLKEFSTAPLVLPREERPEMVRSLRRAGLSQRAIASATGVSQSTVRDDVAELISNYSVPMPDSVTGLDGKKRPAQQPKPDVPQPKSQPVEPDSEPAPPPKHRVHADTADRKPKGKAPVEAKDELPNIDWASVPVSSQGKVEALVRRRCRELEAEFESRVRAEVERREDVAFKQIREMYDRIERFESAQRHGILTESEYKLLLKCVHRDRMLGISEKDVARDA